MDANYDDIINLPHHVSKHHPQMSIENRAAQFAPFAALTGHSAAIQEAGRLTDDFVNIGDDAQKELDIKINFLILHFADQPEISVTYFEPDQRKSGGQYHVKTGNIKKIDEINSVMVFTDGFTIPLSYVIDIESNMFENLNI